MHSAYYLQLTQIYKWWRHAAHSFKVGIKTWGSLDIIRSVIGVWLGYYSIFP